MNRLVMHTLVYFSVATLAAELGLCAVLWSKGRLTREQAVQLAAVASDVDLTAMWQRLEESSRPLVVDQVSFAEVQSARQHTSLDLDLRELAFDKGLEDVKQLTSVLESERQQYDTLKADFDQQIALVRQGATDTALQEVQRQIESVDTKLARDQIIRLLDDTNIDPHTALQFVVTMFKEMPLEKQKKILAEFKTAEDMARLHEILRQIRLGVPDIEVIRDARLRVETFDSSH